MKRALLAIFLTFLGSIVAVGQSGWSGTEFDYSTKADSTRNQVLFHTVSNGVRYFNTDDIIRIDIDDDNNVTVKQSIGSYTYRNDVSEISFKKASKFNVSAGKHFLVENDAVNRYLSEVHYEGFYNSVITQYAVESGYRMDWPRDLSLSTLPASISPNEVISYKIWECWTGTLVFEGEGTVSSIECIFNHLQPRRAYVYELKGQDLSLIMKDTLYLDGQLRMVKSDNTSNIRDIGGWKTNYGNRVKYGRIYRGGRFGKVSEQSRAVIIDHLGINVEIDLRSKAELHLDDENSSNDLNYSVFGNNISYHHFPMSRYDYINEDEVYVEVFRTVLSSLQQGKNIYIHCAGGADRTGAVLLMLEALLGMDDSDMAKDYELTSFAPDYYDKDNFRYLERCTKTFNHFSIVSGKTGTTNEIATQYLLSQGVSQDDIESFRSIMLVPFK